MSVTTIGLLWLTAGLVTVAMVVGTCWVVHRRFPSPWIDYLLGSAAWAISVALKIVGAILLFTLLARSLGTPLRWWVVLPATGLLTGIFECGVALLMVRFTALRRAGWDRALAFGIAFGCCEALVLACFALFRAAMAFTWHLLPADLDGGAIAREMADPTSPSPLLLILERGASIPIHALSCVLIVGAVSLCRPSWAWWSFLFKSLVDAVPTEQAFPEVARQSIYVLMSAIAWWLLVRLHRGPFARDHGVRTEPELSKG